MIRRLVQQHQQANPSRKDNQRNPEVTVRQNGFEHNLSPPARWPCLRFLKNLRYRAKARKPGPLPKRKER